MTKSKRQSIQDLQQQAKIALQIPLPTEHTILKRYNDPSAGILIKIINEETGEVNFLQATRSGQLRHSFAGKCEETETDFRVTAVRECKEETFGVINTDALFEKVESLIDENLFSNAEKELLNQNLSELYGNLIHQKLSHITKDSLTDAPAMNEQTKWTRATYIIPVEGNTEDINKFIETMSNIAGILESKYTKAHKALEVKALENPIFQDSKTRNNVINDSTLGNYTEHESFHLVKQKNLVELLELVAQEKNSIEKLSPILKVKYPEEKIDNILKNLNQEEQNQLLEELGEELGEELAEGEHNAATRKLFIDKRKGILKYEYYLNGKKCHTLNAKDLIDLLDKIKETQHETEHDVKMAIHRDPQAEAEHDVEMAIHGDPQAKAEAEDKTPGNPKNPSAVSLNLHQTARGGK